MTPYLSIIICTYNRDRFLKECLACLSSQNANVETFEVIVIDNNCTDSTPEVCRQFKEQFPHFPFYVFAESNAGLSHARNRGIKESKGEILVFIDDDSMAEPQFIANIISFYKASPEHVAHGGRIYPRFEGKGVNWLSPRLMPLVSALDLGDFQKLFLTNKYPIGANMGFRKSLVYDVGMFNTELGRTGTNLLGGEEKDFFLRIYKLGHRAVYLPDVIVNHVIPDRRLSNEFIKKLAISIGVSEKKRSLSIGITSYLISLTKELFKWAGSLALWFYYIVLGKFPKGKMILQFRSWVTKGLISQKHD